MHVLIPAAGSGRRMGASKNKLLLSLNNQPVLAWTLLAAHESPAIEWIGIMGQPHDWPAFEMILKTLALTKPVKFIEGGATRQESVYRGLKYLQSKGSVTQVLIHDGARCLATSDLFDRCSHALDQVEGLIAAIPVKDTIKVVNPSTETQFLPIQSTPERETLWAAQTPQGFALDPLLSAHQQAIEMGWKVTDDASLFEKVGIPVHVVPGEETNLKVTTPLDLTIAAMILAQREAATKS